MIVEHTMTRMTRRGRMRPRRSTIGFAAICAMACGSAAAQEQCASTGSAQFFHALHYCVSSVRPSEGGATFGPDNLARGDLKRAWCADAPGSGVGATITIRVDGGPAFRRLLVANGHGGTPSAHAANARVKTVEISGDGGLAATMTFADRRDIVPVDLPKMAKDWIRLKIIEVYPGRQSPYACLSFVMPDFEHEEELLLRQQGVIK